MPSSPHIWNRARANCLGFKQQFQEKDIYERSYAKLGLDDLFALLDSASRSAQASVVPLRELMCRRHWTVTATAHKGGFGSKGGGVDKELHFNVLFPGAPSSVRKEHFHVRCKALSDDSLVVFEITNGIDA